MSSIKYVDLEEANRLLYIEKIIKMDELLKYLNKNQLFDVNTVQKYNPEIVKDGVVDLKVGEPKNGKIKTVCLGHPTVKNNSTSILETANKIICFTGGCLCSGKGINIVQAYLIYKLGVDPKLVIKKKNQNQNQNQKLIGKEKFRAVVELLELKGYRISSNKTEKRLSKKEKEQKTIQEILNKTAEIYHQEFLQSEIGKEYFLNEEVEVADKDGGIHAVKGRGFKYVNGEEYALEMAQRYKFGWAPEFFPSNWLYEKLAPDFTTEELLASSVIKWQEYKNEDGKVQSERPVDFHSHGLIMPYWDYRNVSNIYSRAPLAEKNWRHLRNAGGVDKPVNFDNAVRHEVVKIVEGELTWFTSMLFGYENTMGNRGTNGLMQEHIDLLIQMREDSGGAYCETIVLAFDGDKPGREATIKTGEMLVEAGFNVVVVMLPEGMDHNDLLLEYRDKAKEEYDKLYNNAVSFYTFLAIAKMKDSTEKVSDLLVKLAQIKELIADNGITEEAELYLIAKEFSANADIPLDIIWKAWKKENKNTEAFTNQNYLFLTNDIESYYLLRFSFKEKVSYVEDVTFSFISQPLSVKNLVVDKGHYTDIEMQNIESFCRENTIKLLSFYNLNELIDVKIDNAKLINQILTN